VVVHRATFVFMNESTTLADEYATLRPKHEEFLFGPETEPGSGNLKSTTPPPRDPVLFHKRSRLHTSPMSPIVDPYCARLV